MEHKQHIEYFDHWAGYPSKLIQKEEVDIEKLHLNEDELRELEKIKEEVNNPKYPCEDYEHHAEMIMGNNTSYLCAGCSARNDAIIGFRWKSPRGFCEKEGEEGGKIRTAPIEKLFEFLEEKMNRIEKEVNRGGKHG